MRLAVSILCFVMAPMMAQSPADPVDGHAWLEKGVQAYKGAKYKEAINAFQRAVELNPNDVNARLYLGTTFMVLYIPVANSPENDEHGRRAEAEFEMVLRLAPNHVTALASLASLSYQEAQVMNGEQKFRKLDESASWYGKVVVADPGNKEAYYAIGVIDWLKWYSALLKARAQLGMRPDDPGPLKSPALRRELREQYSSVIEDGISKLQKALDIDPTYDDAMAYMNLMIRYRADLADSPEQYHKEIEVADQWVGKTLDTRKSKSRAVSVVQTPDAPTGGGGGGGEGQTPRSEAEFGPDQWPKDKLNHYLEMQTRFDSVARKRIDPQRSAVASKAMIAGTSEPLAIHAGLEVLRHGGNAADAALTTSLAQIALTTGATVSYAGIMTAVYYDAASGKVYTLDAGYNTVRNEKEPYTIPGMGEHSGRTALVPGFMAGVQALHDRFGKLPFAELFSPAVWIAEHGIPLSPVVGGWLGKQGNFATRLPEGKRIFTKENGDLYKAGDVFRQPELAATLKKVAREGSAYMYNGEWAHHFVDLVQREGGKMTLEDLAAYHPRLTEQLPMSYRDYEVFAPNGGATTLLVLKVAEAADLKKYGHYSRSPEALYYLIQMTRIANAFAYQSPERLKSYFPDVDMAPASLLTKQNAEKLWAHIRRPDWPETMVGLAAGKPGPGHSAGVVVVDEQGNVASILHSINCVLWGATGIFVDGISVPDSATFQQQMIARVGPGVRLPNPTNPLLVLKKGKPVLASSAVGSGLHEVTVENVINVLDFAMDPYTSVNQPNTRGPFYGSFVLGSLANKPEKPEYEKEAIADGDFPEDVLDGVRAHGQAIRIVSTYDQPGYWVGIQIDPESRKLRGGATPLLAALVEGYSQELEKTAPDVKQSTTEVMNELAAWVASAKSGQAAEVSGSSPTCVEEATAHSPNVATQAVDIRITNERSNASKIYWLNQQGQRVYYVTLESGAFYTQPTYSEHPWVVTDNDEHCTMFFVATTASHQEVTIRK